MIRLDVLAASFAGISREAAKNLITGGHVRVGGVTCTKAGAKFPGDAVLAVDLPGEMFVSRGGHKLQKALRVFDIKLDGKVCLDIGAATGGFTDCMLQNGAEHVVAIENGHGQLAEILQQDKRVTSLENTDIRNVRLDFAADFAACDLSFISVAKAAEPIAALLNPDAQAVFLIKPQFETGPGHVNKQGVVKNPKAHIAAISQTINSLIGCGFVICGLDFSPITGANGNIEYLTYAVKHSNAQHISPPFISDNAINSIVKSAFSAL